jgi:hypothetical protein
MSDPPFNYEPTNYSTTIQKASSKAKILNAPATAFGAKKP